MAFSLKQFIPFLNPDTDQIADENFSHTQKIIELFHILKQERTVLKISLPESKQTYTSSVLAVDESKMEFTLDEILPQDGHKLLQQYGRLIAHTQVRGSKLSFETYLIGSEKSKQFSSYICHLPETVSYTQRRSEFRIPINAPHFVQVTAEHEPLKKILRGHAYDVSMNGICIVFKTPHVIKPGDQLIRCQMQLSTRENINFTVDVRHIESTSPGSIRVGGCFKDLSSGSQEIISRFVRQMERVALRN
ncbi:flagellar brake protein [Kaarinaea lacus]